MENCLVNNKTVELVVFRVSSKNDFGILGGKKLGSYEYEK